MMQILESLGFGGHAQMDDVTIETRQKLGSLSHIRQTVHAQRLGAREPPAHPAHCSVPLLLGLEPQGGWGTRTTSTCLDMGASWRA